jgi:flavin-dependent dehydrogenase
MVSSVLILGGGLAGGAAAVLAARAGMGTCLIEREIEPQDKMCGEFLSVEAQQHLAALGIDIDALDAVPINRMRLVSKGKTIEAPLPFKAIGVSRRRLDEALLDKAARAGATIERGIKIVGIDGGTVATSAGDRTADHLLLATGKHDVRGARRIEAGRSAYVGFKMHWRLPASQREALQGNVELVLFEGGYAGLQMVGPQTANLCLIVRRDVLAAIGGRWADMQAMMMRDPHIQRRLGDAEKLFSRPITIGNLPYGYVSPASQFGSSELFRLGDQAAMTASLTGDGMAIALRSASLAVDVLKAGGDAAGYRAMLRCHVSGQVRRAMMLQRATQSPVAMALGMGLLRLRPSLLGHLAKATRLPRYEAP